MGKTKKLSKLVAHRSNTARIDNIKFADVLSWGLDVMKGIPMDEKAVTEAFVASILSLLTDACEASMP